MRRTAWVASYRFLPSTPDHAGCDTVRDPPGADAQVPQMPHTAGPPESAKADFAFSQRRLQSLQRADDTSPAQKRG